VIAAADSDLVHRALEAGEGDRLVACLRRCYGGSHVDPALYDAAAIDAALAAGRRAAAVAVNAAGEVVGHIGYVRRRPDDDTADAGLTLVDPRYRGRGIAHRRSVEIGRMALRRGLVGVHDYPVTVHGATQRVASDHARCVGLLLDNMPGDVEWTEMAAAGAGAATASLVRYMGLAPAPPRAVHLPPRYRDFARDLYERGGLDRTFARAERGAELVTAFATHRDARRGVSKLAVERAGADADALLRAIAEVSTGMRAVQVDLPLSDADTPLLAERLRRERFSFGALLPEFRAGDVLRLQRLADAAGARSVPVLESATMRELAAFVQRDAESARGEGV